MPAEMHHLVMPRHEVGYRLAAYPGASGSYKLMGPRSHSVYGKRGFLDSLVEPKLTREGY